MSDVGSVGEGVAETSLGVLFHFSHIVEGIVMVTFVLVGRVCVTSVMSV